MAVDSDEQLIWEMIGTREAVEVQDTDLEDQPVSGPVGFSSRR